MIVSTPSSGRNQPVSSSSATSPPCRTTESTFPPTRIPSGVSPPANLPIIALADDNWFSDTSDSSLPIISRSDSIERIELS